MAPIFRAALRIAVVATELYDRYRRSKGGERRRDKHNQAKRDPAGTFDDHFNGLSDEPDADKAPETGTPESGKKR